MTERARQILGVMVAVILLSLGPFTLGSDHTEFTEDGIVFIPVPAGTFIMGTSDEQRAALLEQKIWTRFEECERPPHPVTISKPFAISKYEVTQKQWKAVMAKNPSAFKGDDLPVESVSWDEVHDFLRKLNQKGEGKYRLPTEAEWEYCCRAGGTNLFGLGQDQEAVSTNNIMDYAWYRGNADNKTHAVGQKKPNAWGICDMHGNVWEWCEDWYAPDYYRKAPERDPLNRDTTAHTERVFRGGSWFLDAPYLRAAFRSGNLPNFKSQYVGFRLVRD